MQHPRLPPELVDNTIGLLHSDPATLLTCAKVCKSWIPASRSHAFHTISCICFNPSKPGVHDFPSEYLSMWASRKRSLSLANLITSDLCTFRSSIRTVIIYSCWPKASSRIKLSPDAIRKDLQDWLDELLSAFARLTSVDTLHLMKFKGSMLTTNAQLISGIFWSITTLVMRGYRDWDNKSLTEFLLLFPHLTTIHCPKIAFLTEDFGANQEALTKAASDEIPSSSTLVTCPLETVTVGYRSATLYALKPFMPRVKNLIFEDKSLGISDGVVHDVDTILRSCGPSLEKLTLVFAEWLLLHDQQVTKMDLSHNTNLTIIQFVTEYSLKMQSPLDMSSTLGSLPLAPAKPILLSFLLLFPIGQEYKKIDKHRTVTTHFNWAEIDRAVMARATKCTTDEEKAMMTKFRVDITISEEEWDPWTSEKLITGASQQAIQKLMPYCEGRDILRISYNYDLGKNPRYTRDGKVLVRPGDRD